MAAIAQIEALTILTPVLGTVETVIRKGFDYYHERYGEESCRHTPRSRASLVNDHIVDFAVRDIVGPEVHLINVQNRRLFDYRGQVLLHFKKLSPEHLPKNFPTPFALEFNLQEDLPGIPSSLPRLVAGYVPTLDWTAIRDVVLMCPDGERVAWSTSITDENSQQIITDLFPSTPHAPSTTQKRYSIRSEADQRDAGTAGNA